MKFSILSGAYVNAGDFLIVDRTIKLLKNIYPECTIKIYERRKKLDNYIAEINKTDALVFAGGPAYMPSVYPDEIPLIDDLDKITTKIITIGLGWYGKNTTDEFMNTAYVFTTETKKLFDRISKDSNNLSCRDWYSVKALQINAFENALMTGCPAWYNLDYVNKLTLRENINIPFKKICISDPANSKNINQSLALVKYLKEKYKDVKLYFVFHRIDKNDNKYNGLQKQLKEMDINIVDITGSSEGFKIYDDCDLHIGYRVHAHIYNLSNRNLSILIEEDGRGAGVNEALGLQGIKAYMPTNSSTYKKDIVAKGIRFIERNVFSKGAYLTPFVSPQTSCLRTGMPLSGIITRAKE